MRKGFFTSLPVLQNESSLPKCGLCKLDKTCKSPKLGVSGNGKKKILIVTEMPEREEDLLHKRICEKLNITLSKYGVSLKDDCWLTSALICRPPNGEIPLKRNPIDWCRPNLTNAIKKYNPEIIIPIGDAAIQGVLGPYWKHDNDWKRSRWGGYQIPLISLNAWICPTYYASELEIIFHRHIQAACKLKGRPHEEAYSPPNYENNIRILTQWKDWLTNSMYHGAKRSKLISFDYETNMLKPDKPESKIYCCSIAFADKKESIAFPWVSGFPDMMKRILEDPSIKKNGWNIQFEDRWSKRFGIKVKNWGVDGMLVAHGVENATKMRKISSLDFQAFVNLGVSNWDGEVSPYLKNKSKEGYAVNKIKDCPLEPLLKYNALDSLYEMLITQKQTREIKNVLQRS
jgi:uracil-DNA glycosylase family 4